MFDKKNPYKLVPLKEADKKLESIQKILTLTKKKDPMLNYINSFEPPFTPTITERENGTVLYNDLCYDTEYPNGFLDIWCKKGEKNRPTVFYMHGGGFFMGHKNVGDPLSLKGTEKTTFIDDLLDNGFNVVNVDYALSPEYRFPTQMIQLDRAVKFILDNAEKYDLDTTRVFFKGGSAGANMSELYGLALCDEEYAKEMGFTPAIDKKNVVGLILDEPALQTRTFCDTNMNVMFEGWMGGDSYDDCKWFDFIDVPKHINTEYIPSFIVSSNVQVFFEAHTRELKEKLDEIGVYNEYFIPAKEEGNFDHGFLMQYKENAVSKRGWDAMLEFMKKHADM